MMRQKSHLSRKRWVSEINELPIRLINSRVLEYLVREQIQGFILKCFWPQRTKHSLGLLRLRQRSKRNTFQVLLTASRVCRNTLCSKCGTVLQRESLFVFNSQNFFNKTNKNQTHTYPTHCFLPTINYNDKTTTLQIDWTETNCKLDDIRNDICAVKASELKWMWWHSPSETPKCSYSIFNTMLTSFWKGNNHVKGDWRLYSLRWIQKLISATGRKKKKKKPSTVQSFDFLTSTFKHLS